MTSPQPDSTLLAAREALIRYFHDRDDEMCFHPPDLPGHCELHADALLASGVVQTPAEFVAGMEEDEATLRRLRIARLAWRGGSDGDFDLFLLRAIAAALGGTE